MTSLGDQSEIANSADLRSMLNKTKENLGTPSDLVNGGGGEGEGEGSPPKREGRTPRSRRKKDRPTEDETLNLMGSQQGSTSPLRNGRERGQVTGACRPSRPHVCGRALPQQGSTYVHSELSAVVLHALALPSCHRFS
jgi:hypothetical protein